MDKMLASIKSVSDFISEVLSQPASEGNVIFYRGHPNAEYTNTPHVFRKRAFVENEHRMITDLISFHPEEFQNDRTALEQLVRAQHYGLPTRLLDLTRNPLISLYFACETPRGGRQTDGAVVVFETAVDRVKSFESDTVSCIANLCFLSKSEKDEILGFMKDKSYGNKTQEKKVKIFNELKSVKRLRRFILTEKSYFQPEINPNSLRQYIAVIPKQSNKRIIAQTGAFLAFGTIQTLGESSSSKVKFRKLRIPKDKKKIILEELNSLHINRKSLFPEIQETSAHIVSEYQTIKRGDPDDVDSLI